MKHVLTLLVVLALVACTSQPEQPIVADSGDVTKDLFQMIPAEQSNIAFINTITESEQLNHVTCLNCYNGAGVAVGDVDNDGLPDIFFAGNQVTDRLYKNLGDMTFKDVTGSAGLLRDEGWAMGVTMADVNGDGWLDIYVCRTTKFFEPRERANLLYINNGDMTFTESAKEYGLADEGYSTHATFFDYDKDGDLDCYIVSRPRGEDRLTYSRYERAKLAEDPHSRDKLYRNDNGSFVDVSKEAGIWNYAYGLSVSIGDINNDGWDDIYVANDFIEHDFLYINQQNGTFAEEIKSRTKHISNFSMGSDIADINNDGNLDVLVVDMTAEDHLRNKTMMGAMNTPLFDMSIDSGYHVQYMLNTLQLNNGDGTFAEIGQMAGVAKTDWSWAALMADYDLDGLKDMYITNGILRDIRHNDYVRQLKATNIDAGDGGLSEQGLNLILNFPSTKISNYLYHNNGNLTFSNTAEESGVDQPGFSNGAAYADLDGDGDLDLVVNNVNEEAFLYENTARDRGRASVVVNVTYKGANPNAIGARVYIHAGTSVQMQEVVSSRGYLSSVPHELIFGVSALDAIDSIVVVWPDMTATTLAEGWGEGKTVVKYNDSQRVPFTYPVSSASARFAESATSIPFTHSETKFKSEYAREVLLPHRMSQFGPDIEQGDINNDGISDLVIAGAAGQPTQVFIGAGAGEFSQSNQKFLSADAGPEDVGLLLVDIDGDGALDLYVATGSNEFTSDDKRLSDRVYLNKNGVFTPAQQVLPNEVHGSHKAVVASDVDGDGDADIFVGGRQIHGTYPVAPRSFMLINENGVLVDKSTEWLGENHVLGMVTDATFADVDKNGTNDLVVVGEWMPVTILSNSGQTFANATEKYGLERSHGWWNSICVDDIDQDGDLDFLAGNLGKNAKYKASDSVPQQVYYYDFNHDGQGDIVLAYYQEGVCYPVRGKSCSSEQMPSLSEVVPTYKEWGTSSLQDIYGAALDSALHMEVYNYYSGVFKNKDGKFAFKKFPMELQMSPIQSIKPMGANANAKEYIVVGNMHVPETETVKYDAGVGGIVSVTTEGSVSVELGTAAGVKADRDARDVEVLDNGETIVVGNNNSTVQLFRAR